MNFSTTLRGCPHTGVWFCNCIHLGVTQEGVAERPVARIGMLVCKVARPGRSEGDTSPLACFSYTSNTTYLDTIPTAPKSFDTVFFPEGSAYHSTSKVR